MTDRISKHHGLGNDFLVWLTTDLPDNAAELAVSLCARRTGIGADGLIFGIGGDSTETTMRLFNSDGGQAEVSGNGLRCLTQAIARRNCLVAIELDVSTLAGVRHCLLRATNDPQTVDVTAEMGAILDGPTPNVDDLMSSVAAETNTVPEVTRFATADIGNPHVVCEVAEPDKIALHVVGPAIESHFADGINVSFVKVSGQDQLQLRVWERGAGVTSACGTGATVASQVFHRWGKVGTSVTVCMPGGQAHVNLKDKITLRGPATHVADISIADV